MCIRDRLHTAGVIATGNEVYKNRIADTFKMCIRDRDIIVLSKKEKLVELYLEGEMLCIVR